MHWLNSNGTTDGYLKKLSTISQNMIYETTWYLGNNKYGPDGDTTVSAYNNERDSSNIYSGNHATWTGKIGLMYPSDYGFSANEGYWNSTKLYQYNSLAASTSWFFKTANNSKNEWFLSPSPYYSNCVAIFSEGHVDNNNASNYGGVRPVLYLKSDILISGGDGTLESPYELSVQIK